MTLAGDSSPFFAALQGIVRCCWLRQSRGTAVRQVLHCCSVRWLRQAVPAHELWVRLLSLPCAELSCRCWTVQSMYGLSQGAWKCILPRQRHDSWTVLWLTANSENGTDPIA